VSGDWRELVPPEYAAKMGEIDDWLLSVDETEQAITSIHCPHMTDFCKPCHVNAIFLAQVAKIGRLLDMTPSDADAFAVAMLGRMGGDRP